GDFHSVEPSEEPCSRCSDAPPACILHNVRFARFRHSDFFITRTHAESQWLPVLWGYDPAVFRRYLRLCTETVVLREQLAPDGCPDHQRIAAWKQPRLARRVADLGGKRWPWTKGETVNEFLQAYIRSMSNHHPGVSVLVSGGRA